MLNITNYVLSALAYPEGSKEAKQTLLMAKHAIRNGRRAIVPDQTAFTVGIVSGLKFPLLHEAVYRNNLEVVKFILSIVKDVKDALETKTEDHTPLQLAVSMGYQKMTEYLVGKGADILGVFERCYSFGEEITVAKPINCVIDSNNSRLFNFIMDSLPEELNVMCMAPYLLVSSKNKAIITSFVKSDNVRKYLPKCDQKKLIKMAFDLNNFIAFDIITRFLNPEELNCLDCTPNDMFCFHEERTLYHHFRTTGFFSLEEHKKYFSAAFPMREMPYFDLSCPDSPEFAPDSPFFCPTSPSFD
jgi:ankyrin repeat protein